MADSPYYLQRCRDACKWCAKSWDRGSGEYHGGYHRDPMASTSTFVYDIICTAPTKDQIIEEEHAARVKAEQERDANYLIASKRLECMNAIAANRDMLQARVRELEAIVERMDTGGPV